MENITCLFDTFAQKHTTPDAAQIKKLQSQFDDLLVVMSADLRDWLIDGRFARVYTIGQDLIVETELCGGVVTPGKRFDSRYQVVTMALSDALDFSDRMETNEQIRTLATLINERALISGTLIAESDRLGIDRAILAAVTSKVEFDGRGDFSLSKSAIKSLLRGTVGLGRMAAKTREEAQAVADKINKR